MNESVPASAAFNDFEEFYRMNRSRLVATLSAVARCDADSATEAIDEGFVRALARWTRVARMEAPAGWVFTVARNQLTRTRARRSAEQRIVSGTTALTARSEAAESNPDLWKAVAELPERERLAIALRYLADFTERQVADVMQVAPGTAAATLHSARQRLAAQLEIGAAQEVTDR